MNFDMALVRQSVSFAGALMILIAYAGQQMGWMNPRSTRYNVLNVIGSGILWYIAMHPFQVGFVVLEGTWTIISVYYLVRPRRAAQ